MMHPSRRLLLAAGLAAPALLSGRTVRAQADWPNRPVRMVLPYSAGGPTDVIGRLVADRLSQRLPQRVVVENRTGAGGNIGASFTAKAPGDGYTLLFTNIGHAVNRALYAQLDYDPAKDLTPVTILAESPMVLLVPTSAPWKTLGEFVAAVRAAPGKYTYGTSGGGGALQLVSLLLLREAGLQMTEVPYRGSGPAALDLAAGNLDMLYDAGLTAFAQAKAGQARALCVSTAQRSPVMPDVPSVAEQGYPGAVFSVWQAIFAPSSTPAPLVERIQREVAAVLAEPTVRSRLAELGAEKLIGNTPAEARAYVDAEMARWEKILREAGIKPQ